MVTRVTYIGDGYTKDFSIPFTWLDNKYLKVTVNKIPVVLNNDYIIENAMVKFIVAPENETLVYIYRDTSLEDITFTSYTINDAETLNAYIARINDVSEEIKNVEGISAETIKYIFDLKQDILTAVSEAKAELAQAKTEALSEIRTTIQEARNIETHVQQMYDEFVAKVDEVLDGGAPDSIYTEPDIDGGEI